MVRLREPMQEKKQENLSEMIPTMILPIVLESANKETINAPIVKFVPISSFVMLVACEAISMPEKEPANREKT